MKKKVLFLLEAFDKGGIEKVTLDIVNGLDSEKYDITVQTFWFGGHCQSQVNENIKVIPFFFKRYVPGIIRLIQYLPPRWLYRMFVRGKYDVEIAASDGGAAKVISGSTNKKSRKICWVHMDVVERGSGLKEFTDARTAEPIYGKFDLIVPVSQSCHDKFISKFGSGYPMTVKRNPLPVPDILRKAEYPIPAFPQNCLNFVCLGRLVEQKGFDRLLDACKELEAHKFHVHVIGEGPKRPWLEARIQELGLEQTVKLLGYSENPYPYLKQADTFLLTSRDEAFPLVVGESLVVGTPVLATDCCGVREWLGDDRYGMILPNSTEGIVCGMKAVLEDPKILERYRSRMLEAQSKISFEKSLADFEDILR